MLKPMLIISVAILLSSCSVEGVDTTNPFEIIIQPQDGLIQEESVLAIESEEIVTETNPSAETVQDAPQPEIIEEMEPNPVDYSEPVTEPYVPPEIVFEPEPEPIIIDDTSELAPILGKLTTADIEILLVTNQNQHWDCYQRELEFTAGFAGIGWTTDSSGYYVSFDFTWEVIDDGSTFTLVVYAGSQGFHIFNLTPHSDRSFSGDTPWDGTFACIKLS